jgi:hypothetical protein
MTHWYSHFLSNRNFLSSWLITLCAVFTLVACGGGGGSNSGSVNQTAPSTVTGVIQDSAGQPVAGARIQLAGQTIYSASTGRFTFNVTSSSESIVMLVKKVGFATSAKDVPINHGSTTDITVKIYADQVSTPFSASAGAILSLTGGASAIIPANGLQSSNGVSYSGTVTVGASYFGPDTLDGVIAFPAPYVGTDAGALSPLITVGVIEVKLTDAVGNPLQLKSGSLATLTYPATSVSAEAASIPMWYYDEANKMWVRDGLATKQSNGTYQVSVSHFTLWNADFKGTYATINGCIQDTNGKPVLTAGLMALRGSGWTGVSFGAQPTADGNFTVIRVAAGIPLELYSNVQTAAFASLAIPSLAPGEVRNLACVVVTNPSTDTTFFITPPSTFFTTSTGSFAGTYAGSYSGSEVGTFIVSVNERGQISGTVSSVTYPGLVASVTGTVGASGTVSMSASGQVGSANYHGTATGAGLVSGTWVYTSDLTGNGVFSGQRN